MQGDVRQRFKRREFSGTQLVQLMSGVARLHR
jgi:hypothetical protein